MSVNITQNHYAAIAKAVAALHSAIFSNHFCALLQHIVAFDEAVIVGYKEAKRPIYLYDSINQSRELLFQRYLTDAFLHDPFYLAIQQASAGGVYTLKEVSGSLADYKSYRREFYAHTAWHDELCLSVKLDQSRWVAVYIGRTQTPHFTANDINGLTAGFELLSSLCHQQWAHAPFSLPDAPIERLEVRQLIAHALTSIGSQVLTKREQQITALLVQGLDSKEISWQLGIGIGTVKNHRKKIYEKLNVSSLSELFQFFLSHLIVAD